MSETAASTIKTVCPYCGVGCGMLLQVENKRVVKVSGDKTHPANFGRLCAKGLTCAEAIHVPGRLETAYLRTERRQDVTPVDIDSAITFTARKLRAIIDQYGPDSVAFYVSGQMSTEAQYVVNKLSKGFIGTNNIDSNSRLCMSSAATGYKQSLGADGPPGSYQDIEQSHCFFIIGSNMADCHPILFLRVVDQCKKSGAKLIVVDPRRTSTADKADLYLQIKPGTDLALLNGLLHLLVKNGHIDKAFIANQTEGWDELVSLVEEYPPGKVTDITGLAEEDIRQAARWIGEAPEWMSFWAMGLNQSTHGTWQTNAICNLHLATGKICRPGSGPFSLTGQPNAMGGREMGYLGHGLPGQRTVERRADRLFIEQLWRVAPGTIKPQPGLDAVSLFRRLAEGEVKAVWMICTNPVASMPNRQQVVDGLKRAEFVISQDAFRETETNRYADVLLPGALWAEAEGVMINSERNLTLMAKAVEPPGQALPDWQIITRVARGMGFADGFSYESAAEVFDELRSTWNPQTGYDLRGVDYHRLRREPVQWPCPPQAPSRNPIRYHYADSEQRLVFPTASGKAQFLAHPYSPPAEPPDEEYPFILNTGRLPHHWHTLTKTGKIAALNKLNPYPLLEIHQDDAKRLDLKAGDRVRVCSRRGHAIYPVTVTDRVSAQHCFVPFHWNDLFGDNLAINAVTNDAVDETSLQPELKYCAVELKKILVQQEKAESPSVRALTPSPFSLSPQVEALRTLLGVAEPLPVQLQPQESQYLNGFLTGVQLQPLHSPGNIPVVPDTAPLLPERRIWVNGLLAGMFSRIPVDVVSTASHVSLDALSKTVTILYASQTGNAESLANVLGQRLRETGWGLRQFCMADYPRAELSTERLLLIVTSTYGDGETPDNGRSFWEFLQHASVPALPHLRYAVLGLGDSNYTQFCQCGKNFDARFAALGAQPLVLRTDCDSEFDTAANQWIETVVAALASEAPSVFSSGTTMVSPSALPFQSQTANATYRRTDPFPARLLVNRRLNSERSRKETRHYEFSLTGSDLTYEAGDVLGIWPTNCPELVEEILSRLRLNPETVVTVEGVGEVSLAAALSRHFEIVCLSRTVLNAVAEQSRDAALQRLLGEGHQAELKRFSWGLQFADLLHKYPSVHFDAPELLEVLKRIQPRLYSLSSSPKAHPGQAHLTVRTIRYTCAGQMRKGAASTFLADRIGTNPTPVFIRRSPYFHPPAVPDTPMIMIGPGTGIAPFRGFLYERLLSGAQGRNWLFFGEQHEASDFYYRDELTEFQRIGILTRLDVAFSRDQAEKVYVQHRLLEQGKTVWAWLQDGAALYVCGDAAHMARDVEYALHRVAIEHGGLSEDNARAYWQRLSTEKRYLRDVY
ncbi:MAG: molybdopterin-dependent oxidoreductase [Candidatus Binatia bacterium]